MEQFRESAPIKRAGTKEGISEKSLFKLVNLAKACNEISYYIERNPDFNYDTFVAERLTQLISEYKINQEVANAIKDRLEKIARSRDTIVQAINRAKKDGTQVEGWQIKLFERMFHFAPKNEIEVGYDATHITFAVNSYEDYAKMFGKWENPANPSGGRAAPTNSIPYTVVRIDKELRAHRDSTDVHENQHILNNIIFGQSEIKAKNKKLDSVDSDNIDNETIYQALVEDFETVFAARIKDEMIAHIKGGTINKHINEYLISNEHYDYLKTVGGKDHLVRRIQNAGLLKNEDGSYMTDSSVIGGFIDRAYAQSRKVATEWLQAADTIDSLLGPRIKNDFYINLLAVTPIHRWKTLAKLLTRIKKQSINTTEALPTDSADTDDEAMAAYIKYEDDEFGMDQKLYGAKE